MMKRQKPPSRLSCRKQESFRIRNRQKERNPKCRKSRWSRMKRRIGRTAASGQMEIKVPIDGMDGAQLRNLVFMLHAQQYLLNRAAGHENIHVPDRLVEDLKEEPGTDQTSFFAIYQNYRKEGRGFWIAADTVTFCIAATGNAVKNRALIELAAFMVSAAKKAKRVQADTRKPENEKYYLRMWLLRIGMGTKASHESRMALLKGLKGWSAFRTEEEAKLMPESRRNAGIRTHKFSI